MTEQTTTPAGVAALTGQLQAALSRGDHAVAGQLAERILALQPAHEPTLAWLSSHARQRGDLAGALHWAEQGVARRPDSAGLQFNLGVALDASGQSSRALQALQAALAAQPDHAAARLWLGSVQERLGQHAASLQSRARAMEQVERSQLLQQPGRIPAELRRQLDAAALALAEGRRQAVDAALRPVRERHGDDSFPRVQRALDHYLAGTPLKPPHPLQRPTLLFVPGLPDLPWFERGQFPFLAAIEAQTDAIREELLGVLADEEGLLPYIDMDERAPAAPMWRQLNRSPRWSGYHLYRHGRRIEDHCRRCPRTAAALDALPLHRVPGHGPESMFSVLRPGAHIPPHTGVINGRLTVHLPLIVPPDCGGLAAGREPRPWKEGECLVFDDSFVHEAINTSAHDRVVLIFDIWNPHMGEADCAALGAALEALGNHNRSLQVRDTTVEGA